MTLQYTLDENDYLQYQLFVTSKSDKLKLRRKNNWLTVSTLLLLIGVIFYQQNNNFLAVILGISGVLSFIFYPLYQKSFYKKNLREHNYETYKNRFGQPEIIEFGDDYIEINDLTGITKINFSAIENTTETGDYFYLKIKTGGHLIIPKSKLPSIHILREELEKICTKLSINYINDLNWKWK